MKRDVIFHEMTLCEIDDGVAKAFPEIKIGVAVIEGVSVRSRDEELEKLKREVEEVVRRRELPLSKRPRVKEMRMLHKRFGSDPRSRRPSAEALLRRVADPQKQLYTINTVVDAYNLSSIEAELPMAAYDLDTLRLPIVLRFAAEEDTFTGLGQTSPEAVTTGELVYADAMSVCCRAYNYRDADRTKVTLDTRNLLVFVDAGATVTSDELDLVLSSLSKRICCYNGGTVTLRAILGAQ